MMRNSIGMAAAAMFAISGGDMRSHDDILDMEAFDILSGPAPRRTRMERTSYKPRSKYMPHIGTKERARFANWPDGPMHVTGHQRRANAAEPLRLAA